MASEPQQPEPNGREDVFSKRLVIAMLGGAALASVAAIGFLAEHGKEQPSALGQIAAAAVGALASLLNALRR